MNMVNCSVAVGLLKISKASNENSPTCLKHFNNSQRVTESQAYFIHL